MALVFAAALACDRGPDTEDNVRKALDQANIQTVEVEVDDEASTVRATAVVGTSGRVLNELTVEALNGRSADDLDGQITDRLDQLLDSDPVLRERDVNVQVTNRMVAITGEVRTAEEKHKVDDLVRAAPGVKDVANGLQIRSQP
jgi:osmotically-inducible protein OsmY